MRATPVRSSAILWLAIRSGRIFWCSLALLFVLLAASRSQAEPLHIAQLDHTSWTAKDGAPVDITELAQDRDGTLWLGGDSGLYNFDGLKFSPFQSAPNDLQLPGTSIAVLYSDRSGALWVGLAIKGIAEIHEHRVVRLYGEKEGLPDGTVDQIIQAADGSMIAVVKGRVFQLRADHWDEPATVSSLEGEEVQCMFFDRAGTLWLATRASVWTLSVGQQHFQRTKEAGGVGVPGKFLETSDGSLWLQIGERAQIRRLSNGSVSSAPSEPIATDTSDFLADSD